MQSVWLPEAVDPEAYRSSKRLAERSIDVLELGRRYEAFHQKITPKLSQRVHLYEQERGQIIFPTREALVQG